MISDRDAEILIERLIRRIEQANTYFLMKMGASVRQIRELKPSEAQRLVQMLKYGTSYDDIIRELAKYTDMNVKDLDDIFSAYAKKDREFYKQFYQYRRLPFVESEAMRRQRLALTRLAQNEMYNFTRTNVLGYTIRDLKGRPQFLGLRETYNRVLDEALLNVGQGKETFDSAMTRIMKEIGGSGLKTVDFESGRSMRLDSAVRMQLKDRLREVHNEQQKIIGEEIGADGVEISVHENPADDHALAQGRQFSNEQYEKLNAGEEAVDYYGKKITLDHDGKNGYRPISTMNCYHYIFSVILGVNKPEYSTIVLQNIIDRNNKGFEFEGKHYTNYEGTQLQRMLERRIREQKDIQTLAKTSGNEYLAGESQNKITILTHKYKELSDVSGLPTEAKRLKVSTYRRSASATKTYQSEISKHKVGEFNVNKYTNKIKPTTNDVVFMPDRIEKNNFKHPNDKIYYDKIPEILNNPDQVYKEMGKRDNTIWLLKEIDGEKVETIIKINSASLYQKKQLGYKNSIIHLHRTREKYINNKEKRGELELLFDIKNKK